jgi:hypothetical protein
MNKINSLPTQFGSLYILKINRKESAFKDQKTYYDAWNNHSRATGETKLTEPVSINTFMGLSYNFFQYPITLPSTENGKPDERVEIRIMGEPDTSITHIVSGIDKEKSNNTIDRQPPRDWTSRLKNWVLKQVKAKGTFTPKTVEELSDAVVEARLKKYNVPYTKLSFEEAKAQLSPKPEEVNQKPTLLKPHK